MDTPDADCELLCYVGRKKTAACGHHTDRIFRRRLASASTLRNNGVCCSWNEYHGVYTTTGDYVEDGFGRNYSAVMA